MGSRGFRQAGGQESQEIIRSCTGGLGGCRRAARPTGEQSCGRRRWTPTCNARGINGLRRGALGM